jgi:RNA polymerase sigma-70 factor (ECF subfamily)
MEHWDEVVESLGPRLLRVATRIVGNTADAEDLVQTAFLEAYKYQQRSPVENWHALLRRILTHRACDLLRKKCRCKETNTNSVDTATQDASPFEQLASIELIEQLQQAVGRLPDQQSRVFWLRYFDQCSNEEIAAALAISTHGVAVALNKARRALAPQFAKSICGNEK